MSRIAHIALFAAYTLIAVAFFLLPAFSPGVPVETGFMLGGFTFLGCGLAHEVFYRRRRDRQTWKRLRTLRRASIEIGDELAKARDEARRIYDLLEATAGGAGLDPSRVSDVVAEVKVLQGLIEDLYASRNGGHPALLAGEEGDEADLPATDDTAPMLAIDESGILDAVRDALREDRVDIFLQPIVSLPQRKTRYYECFSRIRSNDGSLILADQYIELAEQAGLIAAIDNMLLFRGVQLVRRSQRRAFDLGFFCNISPHTVADRDFFRDFIEFMAENAELAPNLIFEFSQIDLSRQDNESAEDLEKLAAIGYRFSMDGVKQFNFDPTFLSDRHFKLVKVEAGLLLEKLRAEPPEFDLRELKASLDRVGIDLIVEKIENEKDLVELLEYPVDFGQGYLFGEPRLAHDLDETEA